MARSKQRCLGRLGQVSQYQFIQYIPVRSDRAGTRIYKDYHVSRAPCDFLQKRMESFWS